MVVGAFDPKQGSQQVFVRNPEKSSKGFAGSYRIFDALNAFEAGLEEKTTLFED